MQSTQLATEQSVGAGGAFVRCQSFQEFFLNDEHGAGFNRLVYIMLETFNGPPWNYNSTEERVGRTVRDFLESDAVLVTVTVPGHGIVSWGVGFSFKAEYFRHFASQCQRGLYEELVAHGAPERETFYLDTICTLPEFARMGFMHLIFDELMAEAVSRRARWFLSWTSTRNYERLRHYFDSTGRVKVGEFTPPLIDDSGVVLVREIAP